MIDALIVYVYRGFFGYGSTRTSESNLCLSGLVLTYRLGKLWFMLRFLLFFCFIFKYDIFIFWLEAEVGINEGIFLRVFIIF